MKTRKQAESLAGSVTKTSKMPCGSYSLPAKECKTGRKLARMERSVCSTCYACKGNYSRYAKGILPAQYKRLNSINDTKWVNAMVILTNDKSGYFRWHDSGDIQSIDHLVKIIEVAKINSHIKYWLPTKEVKILNSYNGVIPDNLIIRVSSFMIDQKPFDSFKYTSTCHSKGSFEGLECKSYNNAGKCLDCRVCWDKGIKNVSYRLH